MYIESRSPVLEPTDPMVAPKPVIVSITYLLIYIKTYVVFFLSQPKKDIVEIEKNKGKGEVLGEFPEEGEATPGFNRKYQ